MTGAGVRLQMNEEANRRRVKLIDRDLQGTATPAEQAELARLTLAMRTLVDSEANLPMAGAERLHADLLERIRTKK